MISPQSHVISILHDNLPTWNIRHGDRPLDGQLSANTAVVYTEEITNHYAIRAGLLANALKILVFTRENAIDRVEDELFTALQELLWVLNQHTATLTWSSARRGVWGNRLGYEISLTVITSMKEDNS